MKSGTYLTSSEDIYLLNRYPIGGMGGLFVSPGYGRHPDRVIDSWELIQVRTGVLHIEENGVEYHVGPGESLLMPPKRRHRGLSEHPEELSFYWVHFGSVSILDFMFGQYGNIMCQHTHDHLLLAAFWCSST